MINLQFKNHLPVGISTVVLLQSKICIIPEVLGVSAVYRPYPKLHQIDC